MATIKPFCALRPRTDLAARMAALPYDVFNRAEARAEAAKETLSFLHIDRPETNFEPPCDIYAPKVYEKAAKILNDWTQKGYFVRESRPCYYIYEQVMCGRSQSGIVACAYVDDYLEHVIKKHENTRAEKEADRIRHIEACQAQTGPIFLAYRANEKIAALKEKVMAEDMPLYDFIAADGVRQRVWRMDDIREMKAVSDAFAQISDIYIADGHHRAASAVKVCQKRRQLGMRGEADYFLSVLFPDDQLQIMPYHRVVKDLNGLDAQTFLRAVAEKFKVTELNGRQLPEKSASWCMYLQNKWYLLSAHKSLHSGDLIRDLDVSVLQEHLLGPILGINDPRTDERIDFVGGIRGLEALEQRCHTDCAVAFAMYPTSIAQLFAVADSHQLMPPKSTWFEPKLLSGLFIHQI